MYDKRPLKYFSTFSGIGGFELGLERALGIERTDAPSGSTEPQIQQRRQRTALEEERSILSAGQWRRRPVHCVGYSEIDRYAAQIYERHFPEHKNWGDITKIDADTLPDFDLFVGGFPCQAFSIAGLRKGFEDTRGTLFFDVARILDARRPTRFVLENVKGLLSHDNGRTFKTIISTLVELGYCVEWQVLNSKDFGVPQNRERVFIIGHLGVEPGPKVFPFGEDDFLSGSARFEKGQVAHALRAKQGGLDVENDYIVAINQRREVRRSDIPGALQASQSANQFQSLAGIRRLTPIECERLQSFPDGWTEGVSDTQRYKCLGNAVTVNVIEAIMSKLYGDDYGLPATETSERPASRTGA